MRFFNWLTKGPSDSAEVSIVSFRGCKFFSSDRNKIEAALRLPTDWYGRKRYDRLNFSVVEEILATGDVCFDVGANIGVYTCIFARLSGDSSNVHAFEPAEHIRKKLLRNIRLNGFDGVNVNSIGLGDQKSEKNFFEVKEGVFRGGVSSFVENENIKIMRGEAIEERMVPVSTLDSYVGDGNISKLKFLKIDVEGFELPVVRGGERVLGDLRPFILMEFDESRHGEKIGEMKDFFGALGYEGLDPRLRGGRVEFNRWNFDKVPEARNILLIP